MTDKTPRERRQQRTRDAILQTAVKMIREKGADNLSLRAIAREIDYSPAGLYEYFSNKDAIIDAVCMRGNEYLARYLNAVDENTAIEEYLVELGLAYVSFAKDNPEMFTLMFSHLNGPVEQITVDDLSDDDAFAILARAVQKAVESGKIHSADEFDLMELSYSLWAVVHGMATLQVTYLGDFPVDFKRIDRFTLQSFIKGLMQS